LTLRGYYLTDMKLAPVLLCKLFHKAGRGGGSSASGWLPQHDRRNKALVAANMLRSEGGEQNDRGGRRAACWGIS